MVRFLLKLGVMVWVLAGVGSAMGMVVTPGVSVGVGYDDNIQFAASEPKSDWFTSLTAECKLRAGPYARRLSLYSRAVYDYYWEQRPYTRMTTLAAGGRYDYFRSRTTRLRLSYDFLMTYNPEEETTSGGLVRVLDTYTRRYSHRLLVSFLHRFNPGELVDMRYSVNYTYTDDPTRQRAVYHRAELELRQRLGVDYFWGGILTLIHDDYETSPDINRGRITLRLGRDWGPRFEVFVAGGVELVRSQSAEQTLANARDYDIYTLSSGFLWRAGPKLTLEGMVGYSRVSGSGMYNAAAGSGYPVASVSLRYKGRHWVGSVSVFSTLEEYDYLGEDTGLTATRRLSLRWDGWLARHWHLGVYGDYIYDDYKQSSIAPGASQGDVATMRVGTVVFWQVEKNWRLGFDGRYVERDGEVDSEDRHKFRGMVWVNRALPMRW